MDVFGHTHDGCAVDEEGSKVLGFIYALAEGREFICVLSVDFESLSSYRRCMVFCSEERRAHNRFCCSFCSWLAGETEKHCSGPCLFSVVAQLMCVVEGSAVNCCGFICLGSWRDGLPMLPYSSLQTRFFIHCGRTDFLLTK